MPTPAEERVRDEPILVDGSAGEGGGQILRTSLAASLLTGTPFEITRIRANRRRPGLLAQHLTAVRAAAEIANASVEGARLHSGRLVFRPGRVQAGEYGFDVGTAGSATLVLQTVLLPLAEAGGPSTVTVTGGTHNLGAPPFEFLESAYLPLLRRMGVEADVQLERLGFHPAGGGRIIATIRPAGWRPLELTERGSVRSMRARAVVSRLPLSIAHRELAVLQRRLALPPESLIAEEMEADGPGNAVLVAVECDHVTEVFTGFGRRGLPAEEVAAEVADQVERYLEAGAPVGPHLADQLLLPLVRAPGSRFLTSSPTSHFETNLAVLRKFFRSGLATEQTEAGVLVQS